MSTVEIKITSENEHEIKRTLNKFLNIENNQGCGCTEVTKSDRMRILRQTTTKDLVDELKTRTGVYAVDIPPHEKTQLAEFEGPAIVLTVID